MKRGNTPEPSAVGVPVELRVRCEELVNRVATGSAFARSPRLRAFFLHICRCALDNRPEAATEQQIGIQVYDRPQAYNPNEDNIVRSQARLLRMKLEHHFANEGREEPVVITVPKGHYLPVFESRQSAVARTDASPSEERPRIALRLMIGAAVVLGLLGARVGYVALRPEAPAHGASGRPSGSAGPAGQDGAVRPQAVPFVPAAAGRGEVRIAAGRSGAPYIDRWGRRWDADRDYHGGVARPGPQHMLPPPPDPGLFATMREARPVDPQDPEMFRYDIRLPKGVYELRLYFADPLRESEAPPFNDTQNRRHLQVNLNGRPLVSAFDAIADAAPGAYAVRVFRDVSPAPDGIVHLEFVSSPEPAFLNALELTPGEPGRLKPIRVAALAEGVSSGGAAWSADNYFIGGRRGSYQNPETGPRVAAHYAGERHGNFSYAIPVAPGKYTVRLHFMETFFSPLVPAAGCQGEGCRVFDVTCNGLALLQRFDISRESGAFQPVVREFRDLEPNGQGKLLLSFSPRANYAEVRAIEVLDQAR